MQYLFTLGRTSSLCFAELEALLKTSKINYKITSVTLSHAIVETENEIDTSKILKQSGGIIKISGQVIRPVPTITKKYKNFGVSLVGFKDNIQKICEEFKKEIKLHYVLPKDGFELSSAQASNGKTLEIIIVKIGEEFQFFQTRCVQDINYWTKKDAGRPHIDDRLGMLPLKVARMMINLGLSYLVIPAKAGIQDLDSGFRQNDMVLLDPFCGMGSIPQEAIDLGFKNVIGADINCDVLKRADENLKWFTNSFSCELANTMMINSDAAKIADKLRDKVDLIVTEPFLGDAHRIKIITNNNIRENSESNKSYQPKKNVEIEIKNIIKGLEKMYTGCLREWKKILKEKGVICMIVPEIEIVGKTFKLPFVEICEKTGYNIIDNYEYSRDKAIVKRNIYILKLK